MRTITPQGGMLKIDSEHLTNDRIIAHHIIFNFLNKNLRRSFCQERYQIMFAIAEPPF